MKNREVDASSFDDDQPRIPNPVSWTHVTLASFEALKEAANGQAKWFVWPDEGTFKGKAWIFNDQHARFQPLLIDRTNAKMMVDVYDRIDTNRNKTTFAQWVAESRGHFGSLWELTEKHTTNAFDSSGTRRTA